MISTRFVSFKNKFMPITVYEGEKKQPVAPTLQKIVWIRKCQHKCLHTLPLEEFVWEGLFFFSWPAAWGLKKVSASLVE